MLHRSELDLDYNVLFLGLCSLVARLVNLIIGALTVLFLAGCLLNSPLELELLVRLKLLALTLLLDLHLRGGLHFFLIAVSQLLGTGGEEAAPLGLAVPVVRKLTLLPSFPVHFPLAGLVLAPKFLDVLLDFLRLALVAELL